MKFQIRPILSEIKDLYSKPISTERFKEYISKLQGDTKGDLALPISGFNPMAKNHILTKIDELERIGAEEIMKETIEEFNLTLNKSIGQVYLVALNIADDLKGGWTNYYSTDFDSKFKLSAFVNRKFCVPYFWTSESYSSEIVKKRTIEYLNRTLFRQNNPQPKTLEDHIEQEVFVAKTDHENYKNYNEESVSSVEKYYLEHKNTEEYDRIFNFFYGDEGSENLGYKKYGITALKGYDYAKLISRKSS